MMIIKEVMQKMTVKIMLHNYCLHALQTSHRTLSDTRIVCGETKNNQCTIPVNKLIFEFTPD